MPLPQPEGLQKEVLAFTENERIVVLGTAGSGKTTMAILRAMYLARRFDQNVLLVTFNKALVTYINALTEEQLSNLHMRNFHKVARGYLANIGLLQTRDILENRMAFVEKALTIVRDSVRSTEGDVTALNRPYQVFNEEIIWIERMGIRTYEEYRDAERIGRASTRISRRDRKYFYQVYEAYLQLRSESGYKYDWDDLATYMDEALQQDSSPRLYTHVIIDEGQDFSPTMIRALAKCVPPNGSLTFFGDVAQQIYGSRISWRNAGLGRPKICRFQQNYRNSKEIYSVAIAISKMSFFTDDVDLVEPVSPQISGPKPALVRFSNPTDEWDFIVTQSISLGSSQSVSILVRDRETVKNLEKRFRNNGVRVQTLHGDMKNVDVGPVISIGTYHSGKGLEFNAVILPFCNSDTLPDQERVIALGGIEEAMKEEIKLLYVGVTRAKTRLFITYTGEPTQLLPKNDGLFQEFNR